MLEVQQYTIDINVYRSSFNKLTIPDLVREYRRIYQAGVELFAEFDPCNIFDNTCANGRENEKNPYVMSFCCHGCRYLTDSGCIAESLWCKLWTCTHVRQTAPREFKDQLNDLVKQSRKTCPGFSSHTGRLDLSDYIGKLYSLEALEAWKTTETSIISMSSLPAS